MNSFLDISIIVPLKNMSGRLGNLTKTLTPAIKLGAEIVIIFDGCDDDSEKEMRDAFRLNYSEIKILQTTGVGPGKARNEGLKSATRQWAVFWDADDLGDIQVLSQLVTAKKLEADLLICDFILMSSSNEDHHKRLNGSESTKLFKVAMNPGIWRMVFRREFILDCEFGTSRMGEDQVFLSRVLALAPRILFIDSFIYTYFLGVSGQLTSSVKNIEDIAVSVNEIYQTLMQPFTAHKEIISHMVARQNLTLFLKGNMVSKVKALRNLGKLPVANTNSSTRILFTRLRILFKVVKAGVHEK
jgi:glycosyltransferase involved in cell wall biosynthesis